MPSYLMQSATVSDDLESHFLSLNKPAFFNSADVFLSIPLEYIPSVDTILFPDFSE